MEHGEAHDTEVRITMQCLPGALWLFQWLVNLNLPYRHTSKAQNSYSGLAMARGWGRGGKWGVTTSRYPLSFRGDENVPEAEVGLAA